MYLTLSRPTENMSTITLTKSDFWPTLTAPINETKFINKLQEDNWIDKYRHENESLDEFFWRIANACASIEEDKAFWAQQYYALLKDFQFTTGGRISANLGTGKKGKTLFNCFINGPVRNATIEYTRSSEDGQEIPCKITTPDNPDNLFNIMLTVLEQAKTLATDGGYGINLSWIRPRGSVIKGIGIAHPGVCAYMDILDTVSSVIVRGNNDGYKDILENHLSKEEVEAFQSEASKLKSPRKGAMMLCLNIDHPDIEEFIKLKRESGRITKANLSVVVSDAFMCAVENDEFWELKFDGVVYKRIKARDLYNLIMESTWNYNDPGVIFVDNANKYNPIIYMGKMDCTNPCCKAGTLVATQNGWTAVENINVGDMIQTLTGFEPVQKIYTYDNTELYRVTFMDGGYLDVSPGHIFHIKYGNEARKQFEYQKRLTELIDLIKTEPIFIRKSSTKFVFKNNNNWTRDEGLLCGLILGDGCINNNNTNIKIAANSKENNEYILNLGQRLKLNSSIYNYKDYNTTEISFNGPEARNLINKFKLTEIGTGENKDFPIEWLNSNKEFLSGLLDGLISSDGNINITGRYPQVRITNISKKLHKKIRLLGLCFDLQIQTYLTKHKDKNSSKINGRKIVAKYDGYDSIMDNDSIFNLFNQLQYISHTKKNETLRFIINNNQLNGNKWITKIKSIEKLPNTGTVYDLYCESDNWNTEGYINRGCGEIGGNPLISTVCLLGSINLTRFVNADRSFDWQKYRNYIRVASRLLDSINDLERQNSIPQYNWVIKNIRQFGMGINGLGSALHMMGINYGNNDKCLKFTEEINKIKFYECWNASAELAKEKGVFPAYRKQAFTSTNFFNTMLAPFPDLQEKIRKYGVRNAKCTTNPPLGNSSVICGNVSNGIEPIFSDHYERTYIIHKWPDGLDKDNIKSILTESKQGKDVVWRGDYRGISYLYEPHNRGLCQIEQVTDYGVKWAKEHGYVENPVLANTISVDDHVAVMKVCQKWIEQSVSKTANLPADFSLEETKSYYIDAWKAGLIGVTTYREGTMASVLSKIEQEPERIIKTDNVKLPEVFENGPTHIIRANGHKFYIHFSFLPEDKDKKYPVALWISYNGKKEFELCKKACIKLRNLALDKGISLDLVNDSVEKCKNDASHNQVARMVSLNLRHNVSISDIISVMENIDGDDMYSPLTAIRRFLSKHVKDGTKATNFQCPNCKSEQVEYSGGCKTCKDCGWTACS